MNGEIIKYKIALLACALLAPLFNAALLPSASAKQVTCQKYDFRQLFYADYKSGTHWDNSNGDLKISWTAQATTINDEPIARSFSQKEVNWLRLSFKSWDAALDTVSFVEVAPTETPQITIGYVELKPQTIQPGAFGFWNSWANNGIRTKATIKLKASESAWFVNQHQFIHTVQHELGNVLGLGDIAPTKAFASVLEDPWQPPYGRFNLSATDIAMIKQLYGERNNCH